MGLSYSASGARAGAGLNSGEESGSGTPAVQRWPVGLSLGLSAFAAEAQAQLVKASRCDGASPSPGEELEPESSKPPPPSNNDDMMNDLKLFSKAQLTSYGKRWNRFSSNENIAMELDIRKMYTRRCGPVTNQVWTRLWDRLHSHSISRSSPRGSRTHRSRSLTQ